MVKKNTNEHDYYKPLSAFLTYHFGKTPGNETKLANVLHYCKTNWARISEHELDSGDLDENVKTLLEIQPMDVARYLKYLAYGTETPAPEDKPTGRRANSLLAYKRAISFYMPLNENQWNSIRKEGNPTRSKAIGVVIKKIKQAEARKQGARSRAVRAYTCDEFNAVIKRGKKKVMKREKEIVRFVFSALVVLQNSLAGRIDDMIMVDVDEIRKSYQHGLIEVKLSWSKNIYAEEATYWQLVVGSMDSMLCPLIAIGAYVGAMCDHDALTKHQDREIPVVEPEVPGWFLKQHAEPLLPGLFRIARDVKLTKASVRIRLQRINAQENIKNCSTHSVRKKACEEMQDCQLHRAISVQRGRWQSNEDRQASSLYHKRLNKGYDYQAAECLAGPLGPCRYEVQNLTATICDIILPAGKVLSPGVQEILTAAVIWASKDTIASELLSSDLKQRITDYQMAHVNFQPSRQRVRIHINRNLVNVIDDLNDGSMTGDMEDKVELLISEVRSLKRQNERESQLNAKRFKSLNHRVDNLSQSVDRVISFRTGNVSNDNGNVNGNADLADCKTLSQLWAEWQFGISGNKPASKLSMAERNKKQVKHRYQWRKSFWLAMGKLVLHTSAEIACDRVGQVYGSHLPGGLSGLCKRIKADRLLTNYYEKFPI